MGKASWWAWCTVTGVTAGTCTIAANQAGNGSFNATPQVTQSFSVGLNNQTIAFGATPTAIVGGTGAVSATATSGLTVSFTSSTPGVCTVSGSTVTGVTAGTCTVAANQAGNSGYNAAPQVTQSFNVGNASAIVQTISLGTPPTGVVVGGSGTLSASGGASGNAISFSSNTPGVCTVVGNTVIGVTAGTCTIAANQTGNGSYNAAPQATQSFAVGLPGAVTAIPTLSEWGMIVLAGMLGILGVGVMRQRSAAVRQAPKN